MGYEPKYGFIDISICTAVFEKNIFLIKVAP